MSLTQRAQMAAEQEIKDAVWKADYRCPAEGCGGQLALVGLRRETGRALCRCDKCQKFFQDDRAPADFIAEAYERAMKNGRR